MNAYANAAYKKQSVTTMTPIEVIVKLYTECEAQLHRAVKFIEEKNIPEAHKSLDASGELVNALRSVLDMEAGGEISTNLDSLYDFFFRQIVLANTKKDTEIIKQIIPQIKDLRETFTQLSKMTPEQLTVGAQTETEVTPEPPKKAQDPISSFGVG